MAGGPYGTAPVRIIATGAYVGGARDRRSFLQVGPAVAEPVDSRTLQWPALKQIRARQRRSN